MKNKHVYIADIKTIFPKQYPATYVADKLFPVSIYGSATNESIKIMAEKFAIHSRTIATDLDYFPGSRCTSPSDDPKYWGTNIINELTRVVSKPELGMFCLGYNASFHKDVLPNLACQVGMEAGIEKLEQVEEISYYGCAAGVYCISKAVDYCHERQKPVVVFVFDQCSSYFLQLDKDDPDFKKQLITNLLFTDGGVGLLIIPERFRKRFNRPLIKINDVLKVHQTGNLIKMQERKFLMNENLRNVIPPLVSDFLVKPLLQKNKLSVSDIVEWSIHQGGTKILRQFLDERLLGLTEVQLHRSQSLFYKYGNTSCASALLVLESFFNASGLQPSTGTRGMLVGFGAGYYLGAMLYEWT